MSDKHEPLSAILAEMRDFAKPRRVGGDLCSNIACPATISIWADRIDAAAERERDEDRQLAAIAESDESFARCARCDRPERAPGNAAAMREALEQAKRDHWYDMSPDLRNKIFAALAAPPTPPSDAAKMREAILAIKSVNDRRPHDAAGYEINDIIEAALAAPARNCDRTKDEAESAFKAKFGRPWNTAEDELASWLFAPAEGGAE